MLFCEGIVDDGEVAGLDERELVVALGFGLGFWVVLRSLLFYALNYLISRALYNSARGGVNSTFLFIYNYIHARRLLRYFADVGLNMDFEDWLAGPGDKLHAHYEMYCKSGAFRTHVARPQVLSSEEMFFQTTRSTIRGQS
jgi:hypothetical protein